MPRCEWLWPGREVGERNVCKREAPERVLGGRRVCKWHLDSFVLLQLTPLCGYCGNQPEDWCTVCGRGL